jgi:hypothetical protein
MKGVESINTSGEMANEAGTAGKGRIGSGRQSKVLG